jgi:mannose-1-phosphate guanylyltransferase/mannose-6-phosphate isomerase
MEISIDSPIISNPAARGTTTIVPVILSGGSGTRLWPVSRESFPKQFWALTSAHTLIQQTALRAVGEGFADPIVVCNQEHRFIVAEQLRQVGIETPRILLEPVGRNSAPAIAAAALLIARENPQAVMWVMAADAAITRPDDLAAPLATAAAAARLGHIATFGIRPDRPETGYGYIEVGQRLADVPGAHELARFVEKPDRALAEQLLGDERYLWNSGMFLFTAETLLNEMQAHAPAILTPVRRAVEDAMADLTFIRLEPSAFGSSPSISFDYAIAEVTSRAAVVPAEFGWTDVGTWSALWQIGEKDESGNITDCFNDGMAVLKDTENCYIRADGVVAAVAGVQDIALIVTKDAALVVHRDRAQDVSKLVAELKLAGRSEAHSHNRMYRPWGFYESLIFGERFQVKRIVVNPGHKLSLQKHFHRAEHWVVVNGTAEVTRDAEVLMVRENESVYLPLGCVHRLFNPGKIPLVLIEVQSGAYLGEDDIVRLEDTYKR